MDIVVIIFIMVILWKSRVYRRNEEYIGRESTTAIKGIFAILILFSHVTQYIPPFIPPHTRTEIYCIEHIYQGSCRLLYDNIIGLLGQLIVVMFLVYSGYGIIESYKRKRSAYLKGFMKKRVLKTLVHFDIAVVLFIVLALIIGHEYAPVDYALCWIGWTSVGNSNWFIFDIMILYLLSYFGLAIVEKLRLGLKSYLCMIFALSFCFLIVLFKMKSGLAWWYDTILAFPMGMLWSVYKERLENIVFGRRGFAMMLLLTGSAFVVFYLLGKHFKAVFSFVASPLFGLLIIILTTRIRVGNPALNWLGINAFYIYILQRLAMIIATQAGLNKYPLLFLTIVIPATLLMAALFTTLTSRIDRKLFS